MFLPNKRLRNGIDYLNLWAQPRWISGPDLSRNCPCGSAIYVRKFNRASFAREIHNFFRPQAEEELLLALLGPGGYVDGGQPRWYMVGGPAGYTIFFVSQDRISRNETIPGSTHLVSILQPANTLKNQTPPLL